MGEGPAWGLWLAVAAHCERRRISVREFARRAGVSRETVARLRVGAPRAATVGRITAALNDESPPVETGGDSREVCEVRAAIAHSRRHTPWQRRVLLDVLSAVERHGD